MEGDEAATAWKDDGGWEDDLRVLVRVSYDYDDAAGQEIEIFKRDGWNWDEKMRRRDAKSRAVLDQLGIFVTSIDEMR